MFEESLVESTALLQNRARWPAMVSVAVQVVAVLILLAVPLLHPELLPMHAPALSLAPPPPLPHPPQPPPPVQHVHAELANTNVPSVPVAESAHTSLIRNLLPTPLAAPDTPISIYSGPPMNGTSVSETLGVGATNKGPHVSLAPALATHVGPVKISSGVTQGLLFAPIHAEYPAIARAARVEGTVVVRAIISRTGKIERAEILSGPAMLHDAALQAVEQARYHPFLLNGEPTEVDTTVTITFRMGS